MLESASKVQHACGNKAKIAGSASAGLPAVCNDVRTGEEQRSRYPRVAESFVLFFALVGWCWGILRLIWHCSQLYNPITTDPGVYRQVDDLRVVRRSY
jgi:hypothetical protein